MLGNVEAYAHPGLGSGTSLNILSKGFNCVSFWHYGHTRSSKGTVLLTEKGPDKTEVASECKGRKHWGSWIVMH